MAAGYYNICYDGQVSEYYSGLSAESKQRYTDKVTGVGLRKDPYAIPSELWQAERNHVPNVALNDMRAMSPDPLDGLGYSLTIPFLLPMHIIDFFLLS